MGHILYGDALDQIEVDDRTLAHVKVVMLAKLRRNESFAFSFLVDQKLGGGRSTVWIHPALTIRFNFDGQRRPTLNRAWIDALMVTANSVDGLALVEEPENTGTGSIPTV